MSVLQTLYHGKAKHVCSTSSPLGLTNCSELKSEQIENKINFYSFNGFKVTVQFKRCF